MLFRALRVASLLVGLSLAGCGGGGSSGQNTGDCLPGSFGCACADGGLCDADLVCSSTGHCVAANPGPGGGSGGTGGNGGTGGTGATAGTGGSNGSGVTCVGTPTGSCSDPLCDTYPGCVATQASSCEGKASSCSAFDDAKAACDAQWGCGAVDGLCSNASADCDDFSFADICNDIPGCSWIGFCDGTAVKNCATRTSQSDCEAYLCIWDSFKVAYCSGVATECAAQSVTTCKLQDGCTLAPATCSGEPTPCEELSVAECPRQPGCQLSTGSNPSVTPTGRSVNRPDLIIVGATIDRRKQGGVDYLFFDFDEINRGTVVAGPHTISMSFSVNDIAGDEDDVRVRSFEVNFDMDPYGLTKAVMANSYLAMTSFEESVAPGYYHVILTADADDDIVETEEDNNTYVSEPLFIGPATLDLAATELRLTSSGPFAPGDDLEVGVTIENRSTEEVPSIPVRLMLSDDDALGGDEVVCTQQVTLSLDVGEATEVRLDCPVPRLRGSYYVLVEVDPADTLGDEDRTNNVIATPAPISVAAPSPDLTVASVLSSDWSVGWKDSITVTATVENLGSDPSPATGVAFYLSKDGVLDGSDPILCTQSAPGIAASSTVDVEKACALPSNALGTYSLIAEVDYQDNVFETDESNNVAVSISQLTIAPPSFNLQAESVSFSPFTVSAGGMLDVAVTLGNTGQDDIPGFLVHVYASTDPTITTADELLCFSSRPTLPAQTAVQFQLACTVPTIDPGTYWLGVLLDPDDALPETNENDNVAIDSDVRLTIE